MKNNKLNLWFGALLASIPYNDKQERGQNMDNIKTGALIRELRKEKI